MHGVKILGCLRASGWIVHFAVNPFNNASALQIAETALITNPWRARVTSLTRARLIARPVVVVAGRRSGGCDCSVASIKMIEHNMGATRGLAFVILAIGLFVNFFGGFES